MARALQARRRMTQTVKRRVGGGWYAALLALLVGAGQPLAQQGFRQDELECEEALAHLDDCCEDFDPAAVDCNHVDGCDTDTFPTISVDESQCIRDKSCESIRRDGICQRVLARQSSVEQASEEVCR
jgi:hypothetical protein